MNRIGYETALLDFYRLEDGSKQGALETERFVRLFISVYNKVSDNFMEKTAETCSTNDGLVHLFPGWHLIGCASLLMNFSMKRVSDGSQNLFPKVQQYFAKESLPHCPG